MNIDANDAAPGSLVVTADELTAIAVLFGEVLPPGIAPDRTSNLSLDAGLRSLVARGFIKEDAAPSPALAVMLTALLSADRRLVVVETGTAGVIHRGLHVGPQVGLSHVGRPAGLSVFDIVAPEEWVALATDAILGPEPQQWLSASDAAAAPIDELAEQLTRTVNVAILSLRDGTQTSDELTVIWTDSPWLVDHETSTAKPASEARIREFVTL